MRVLMVILGFALIGLVCMGIMFDWSVKFCIMGSIVGAVWAVPYGILIWR